eukprot:GHVL01011030.1.p1 GENE.GHVL01011030.1~~GHVL01011030.1.p1  ORF type:complete len:294 (+),score=51.68 GHVL01011030.1:35-916(+)
MTMSSNKDECKEINNIQVDKSIAETEIEEQPIIEIDSSRTKTIIESVKEFLSKQAEEAPDLITENVQWIFLSFTLALIPKTTSGRQARFRLKHSIYGPSDVCFVTKDEKHKCYKSALKKNPVPQIKKVVSVRKLKKNYKQARDRKILADTYDLFLCDRLVYEMMFGCLGKKFEKKIPLPVQIRSEEDLKEKLEYAIGCTYMRNPRRDIASVKIGHTNMTADELVDNCVEVTRVVENHFNNEKRLNRILNIALTTNQVPEITLWRDAEFSKHVKEQAKVHKAALASKVKPLEEV